MLCHLEDVKKIKCSGFHPDGLHSLRKLVHRPFLSPGRWDGIKKNLYGRENGREGRVETHAEDLSLHCPHLFGGPQREVAGGGSTLSVEYVQDQGKQMLIVPL